MKRRQLVAAVGLGCSAAAGCGGDVEGVRCAISGDSTGWEVAAPDDNMVLDLSVAWSHDEEFFDLDGTDDKSLSSLASSTIGPWTPTSEPSRYAFSISLDVPRPTDADRPLQVGVDVQSPMFGDGSVVIVSHEVDEDDVDGWIPARVVVFIRDFLP